jgi:hypothetical protein
VKQLSEGHVEWTMAAPLWRLTGDPTVDAERLKFRTPTILRFATDTFMDDFHDLLTTQPYRLNEYVAAPETWSSPPGEPAASPQMSGLALTLFRARNKVVNRLQARGSQVIGASSSTMTGNTRKVFKLYQPVHQRYYLITTCLVCRMLGLPDRKIDVAAQESATFVMRLLQPHASADPIAPDPRNCDEFALVNGTWQPASDGATLVTGEEQHALAPAAYTEDDARTRRLLVGLIPVGDRERLMQAMQPNPARQPDLPPMPDSRQMLLKSQVIVSLSNLQTLADHALDPTKPPGPNETQLTSDQDNKRQAGIPAIVQRVNFQLQQSSWYILLDLASFIQNNLDASLWQAIQSGDGSSLSDSLKPIWTTLSKAVYSGTTMVTALRNVDALRNTIESMKTAYPTPDGIKQWPSTLFQFYTVTTTQTQAVTGFNGLSDRATFEQQIASALPVPPSNPMPPRLIAQASANPNPVAPAWFAIRCVLERPNCPGLTPPLISEPTTVFQLAAYFDSDAPARPIRIGLPIDTTPAGLRKFDKNTAFILSDTLCGQVQKMQGMSFADLIMSVLPFPLHKDLDAGGGSCSSAGLGMVCSFSIPIITIVALILLLIFVKLLDIVFFWMPFFQICLPLPTFSSQDS